MPYEQPTDITNNGTITQNFYKAKARNKYR